MVTENKVSESELQKAMNNFSKAALFPSGMAGIFQNIIPSANTNPLMAMQSPQFQTGMPGNMGQIQPAQVSPQQAAIQTAQQYMAMANLQQQNPMMQAQSYKAMGLQSRIRLGATKVRTFGQCKDCANFYPSDSKMDKIGFCNNKQIRCLEEDGLIFKEIINNGKTEKLIDSDLSCRRFVPLHKAEQKKQ